MTDLEPEVFKGGDDKWYWRLKAANGEIVAVGGEGFARKGNALKSAEKALKDD